MENQFLIEYKYQINNWTKAIPLKKKQISQKNDLKSRSRLKLEKESNQLSSYR